MGETLNVSTSALPPQGPVTRGNQNRVRASHALASWPVPPQRAWPSVRESLALWEAAVRLIFPMLSL